MNWSLLPILISPAPFDLESKQRQFFLLYQPSDKMYLRSVLLGPAILAITTSAAPRESHETRKIFHSHSNKQAIRDVGSISTFTLFTLTTTVSVLNAVYNRIGGMVRTSDVDVEHTNLVGYFNDMYYYDYHYRFAKFDVFYDTELESPVELYNCKFKYDTSDF
jgi:hypothetical protein